MSGARRRDPAHAHEPGTQPPGRSGQGRYPHGMSVVFHIAARSEWEAAVAAGTYRTGSLDTEGFIHCSTAEQVAGTANRLFAGRTDLVLLCIDVERLEAELRYEPVADPPGASFPHVFGPIHLAAVFEVVALEPGPDGRFDIPLDAPGQLGQRLLSASTAATWSRIAVALAAK